MSDCFSQDFTTQKLRLLLCEVPFYLAKSTEVAHEHLSFTISVLILKSLDITNHGLLQFLQVAKVG